MPIFMDTPPTLLSRMGNAHTRGEILMTDHHTEQRQAWLRMLREPTLSDLIWDTTAVILAAVALLIMSIAGGYDG